MKLVAVEFESVVDWFIMKRFLRLFGGILMTLVIFGVMTSLVSEPTANWLPRLFLSSVIGALFHATLVLRAKEARYKRDLATGLYRRMWIEELMSRMTKVRQDVTVAIIDVNSLKEVNKRGYAFGDEFLESVAARLQKIIGRHRYRWLGRLGGDEFVVLGINVSVEDLADEVRWALHARHPLGDMGMGVAGVAGVKYGDWPIAMKCADMALLRAKRHYYATKTSEVYEFDVEVDGKPDMDDRPMDRMREGRK